MSARRLVKRRYAPIVSVPACSGKIAGFSAGASSQSLYQNAAASAGVRLAGRVLGAVSTAPRARSVLHDTHAAPLPGIVPLRDAHFDRDSQRCDRIFIQSWQYDFQSGLWCGYPQNGECNPCARDGRCAKSQLGTSRYAHGHGGDRRRVVGQTSAA